MGVRRASEAQPNILLRAARKERGWTQKEVAERIGASLYLNVCRWERGTAFPNAYYVEKLCLLFQQSAAELGLLQNERMQWRDKHAVSQSPDRCAAPSAPVLWKVPYQRNLFFTGREDVLASLHRNLTASQNTGETHIHALSGLGGIGKTQLAVEYLYRHRDQYSAIFWIRAATRETLIADIMALAPLLLLPERDGQHQEPLLSAVKRWFDTHDKWLLVLDEADDLDLLTDFLPTGGTGHILLTTCTQATGTLATSISVEKMTLVESAFFLLRRAKLLPLSAPLEAVPQEHRVKAEIIGAAMDGLPLAIEQAGAYIEETGCELTAYLEMYQQHQMHLLCRRGSISSLSSKTVATVWSPSFQAIEHTHPAAGDLLRLIAFLAPDPIPEALLREGIADLGPILQPLGTHALKFNEAVEVLKRCSLIQRYPDAKLLTIHHLVQVIVKNNLNEEMRRQWAINAVRAVSIASAGSASSSRMRNHLWLPHMYMCAELIEEYRLVLPEATHLLKLFEESIVELKGVQRGQHSSVINGSEYFASKEGK